jgi:parallel beta-helix repeat protein
MVSIALGANISTTVSGNAAGTTYQFAPGTYYGQTWSPQAGDTYLGDPSGLTTLSGAWVVTSWSGSGSTYKATQGLSDLNGTTQTGFPATDSMSTVITGFISGTTLTVSSTVSGAVAQGTNIWDATGATAAGTYLVSGSGTSWVVSQSQTVGSSGSHVTFYLTSSNGTAASQFPMANFCEDLYVGGVRYTRIPTPGPAIAGTWWLNPSDKSINVSTNLGASIATWSSGTVSGTTLTVGGTVTGTIVVPCVIAGSGVTAPTQIIGYGTGTGGAGTYILDNSMTIGSSEAMTAQALVEYAVLPHISGNSFGPLTFSGIIIDKWASTAVGGVGVIYNTGLGSYTNCIFQNIHGAALSFGNGSQIVSSCKFISCGMTSMVSFEVTGIKITDSELAYCNWAGFSVNWSCGGIKLASAYNVLIAGCRIHDNYGPGIWFDVECSGITITGNSIYNNSAILQANEAPGIEFEISKGISIISNNTIYNNNGSGIYIANSSGVEVYGNVVTVGPTNVNIPTDLITGGINAVNYPRGADGNGFLYELRNLNVHNNVIIHTTDTASDGILIAQAIGNPNLVWNNNIYIVPNATANWFEFDPTNGTGSPTFYTWAQLQTAGVYETTGQLLVGTPTTSYTQIMGGIHDYRNLLLTLLASANLGPTAPFLE